MADKAFLTNARADIDTLLAEVERLRTKYAELLETTKDANSQIIVLEDANITLRGEVERLRTENAELEAANNRMWRIHEWQDKAGIIGGKCK